MRDRTMPSRNNGEGPAGTSSAATAGSGVPKVRHAFALPGPAAGPTTEFAPATARAAATEGDGATGAGARRPEPARTGPEAGSGPSPDRDTDVEAVAPPPEPAREPVPHPEPESTAEPRAGAPGRAGERADTGPGPDTAGRSGEQSAGEAPDPDSPHDGAAGEADAAPGRPKKPILAAAAIAGAVLVSVPFLMPGPGPDRTSAVAASDSTDGTVLEDRAPRRPGRYAAESPSPSPPSASPRPSPSSEPASPGKADRNKGSDGDDGDDGDKAEERKGTRVREATGRTPTPAEAPGRKSGPAVAAVTAAGDALVSKDSGKCLSAGRGTDGTQLVLSTCNGSAEQRWDFRPDGTIRSKGLCMDVAWASKENGTAIQVARCSGNPAQQFHLNGTEDLVAGIADKCVDVYDGRTTDGTPAILWPCTGSANQTWYRR
ncbi:RICIN domain-containing protein [Streptomyces pini]|uniref:Ricin-type beta-trefoil lectin domain-containing protein n=1 Tax=Streptomyces pini TaxID=1520580 RepID=A0A1I4GUI0_9ACTN|nr:RICIN domain-containing protein [Streptomyces pini]SFL33635.1 Ricin-type beta-trefoil lectin domain-containing protein [Streptomyces pini]